MLTFSKQILTAEGKYLRRGSCLSTDTKPTGGNMGNGSVLKEIDTGAVYRYNAAASTWVEDTSGNGTETWTEGGVTYTAAYTPITYGTTEFEDGVTPLPTGVVYLQIEE